MNTKELTEKIASLIDKEMNNFNEEEKSKEELITFFTALLVLNKIYFRNIILNKFCPEEFLEFLKTDITNLTLVDEWKELYSSVDNSNVSNVGNVSNVDDVSVVDDENITTTEVEGGAPDFNAILDKVKNVSSKFWTIINDEDIRRSTGKLYNIIKGNDEHNDDLEMFVKSIYKDFDPNIQNFYSDLEDKVAKLSVLEENIGIFRNSSEKCKEVFLPAYREIMGFKEYNKEELKNIKPTKEDIKLYNEWLLDKLMNEMSVKIEFEKKIGPEKSLILNKLIAKNIP